MILNHPRLSYNDLTIVPSSISEINSRKECIPFVLGTFGIMSYFPIFASPMNCVVSEYNLEVWEKNGIYPILPRKKDELEKRLRIAIDGRWIAVSLSEFSFISTNYERISSRLNSCGCSKLHILIDIANGHMINVLKEIKKAKERFLSEGINLIIMYGNVANPETYLEYAKYGVDYIRVGIGGGHCCITSSNTSVHYPQASLINEMYLIKEQVKIKKNINDLSKDKCEYLSIPKIVADGGIRNYSDIIKALGLGADYVMVGSLFGGFFESSGEFTKKIPKPIYNKITNPSIIRIETIFPLSDNFYRYKLLTSNTNEYEFRWDMLRNDEELKRELIKTGLQKRIYGMSTKKAQSEIGDNQLKTSEGISRIVDCKYTIMQWTENFEHYLRSAMSYCGKKTLKDFIGRVDFVINTASEQYAVNK